MKNTIRLLLINYSLENELDDLHYVWDKNYYYYIDEGEYDDDGIGELFGDRKQLLLDWLHKENNKKLIKIKIMKDLSKCIKSTFRVSEEFDYRDFRYVKENK